MAEFGVELWRLSSPTAQTGPPRPVCPGACPDDFWISSRLETHNLSGQVHSHPHSKNVFPGFQREPPVFVCAYYVWSCHWASPKRAWLHLLWTPSLQVFVYIDEVSLNLLQAEQSQLCQPFLIGRMLQSLHHLCGPLLDSSVGSSKKPRTGHSTHKYGLAGAEWKDHLPQPAGNIWPNAAQDAVSLLCCNSTLLAHILPYSHTVMNLKQTAWTDPLKSNLFQD